MTKLKTLKDLEGIHQEWMGLDCMVSIKKLRQEAIKWAKDIKFGKDSIISSLNRAAVISWIKWFFNITEIELKGGKKDDRRN